MECFADLQAVMAEIFMFVEFTNVTMNGGTLMPTNYKYCLTWQEDAKSRLVPTDLICSCFAPLCSLHGSFSWFLCIKDAFIETTTDLHEKILIVY